MDRDSRAAEALVTLLTGDPKRDRLALRGLLAQASDESRPSPFDDIEFGEWWDRYGRWLWRGWPEEMRPHPGWVAVLRAALDEGPSGFDWIGTEDWDESLETVLAVWLLRNADSILPLLHELIRPTDHPRLAFVVVHDYLERGPHPLTPGIVALLEGALPHVPLYDDETAEWLVHALRAARADGLLDRLATLLSDDQPEARRVLADDRTEG